MSSLRKDILKKCKIFKGVNIYYHYGDHNIINNGRFLQILKKMDINYIAIYQ